MSIKTDQKQIQWLSTLYTVASPADLLQSGTAWLADVHGTKPCVSSNSTRDSTLSYRHTPPFLQATQPRLAHHSAGRTSAYLKYRKSMDNLMIIMCFSWSQPWVATLNSLRTIPYPPAMWGRSSFLCLKLLPFSSCQSHRSSLGEAMYKEQFQST